LIRFCARQGERLSGILHRALKEHGMARRLPQRLSPELWESAVGRQIAARAQPTVLSAGTLHVLVQDHRWRDQLDAARMFLIERLNARLGKDVVRTLQFGLAHEGALQEGRRRAGIGEPLRVEAPPAPAAVLEARLDPGVREAVLRAAEAAARKGSRRGF
jgi:predicted nucleic acid-binding Zn ribbon protein